MAVADVYDALLSHRIYKAAMTHEQAVETIRSESGTHFDPDIIAAFLSVQDEFHAITIRFTDSNSDIKHKSLP